jgi:hypothetical protein
MSRLKWRTVQVDSPKAALKCNEPRYFGSVALERVELTYVDLAVKD